VDPAGGGLDSGKQLKGRKAGRAFSGEERKERRERGQVCKYRDRGEDVALFHSRHTRSLPPPRFIVLWITGSGSSY